MKVLFAHSSFSGPIILDASTAEKERAAYLFMFRYMQKHTGYPLNVKQLEIDIEKRRLECAGLVEEMKEKILLFGKDDIKHWLTDQRRRIKDYEESINAKQLLIPVVKNAESGDGLSAMRLFRDQTIASPYTAYCGLGDPRRIWKSKVCNPVGLRVPKRGSPSFIQPKPKEQK